MPRKKPAAPVIPVEPEIEPEEAEDEDGDDEEEGGGTGKPARKEACRAMCFKCCGDMVDGQIDCGIPGCPLYEWQPYRKGTKSLGMAPDYSWRENGGHLKKNRRAIMESMKPAEPEPPPVVKPAARKPVPKKAPRKVKRRR